MAARGDGAVADRPVSDRRTARSGTEREQGRERGRENTRNRETGPGDPPDRPWVRPSRAPHPPPDSPLGRALSRRPRSCSRFRTLWPSCGPVLGRGPGRRAQGARAMSGLAVASGARGPRPLPWPRDRPCPRGPRSPPGPFRGRPHARVAGASSSRGTAAALALV